MRSGASTRRWTAPGPPILAPRRRRCSGRSMRDLVRDQEHGQPRSRLSRATTSMIAAVAPGSTPAVGSSRKKERVGRQRPCDEYALLLSTRKCREALLATACIPTCSRHFKARWCCARADRAQRRQARIRAHQHHLAGRQAERSGRGRRAGARSRADSSAVESVFESPARTGANRRFRVAGWSCLRRWDRAAQRNPLARPRS